MCRLKRLNHNLHISRRNDLLTEKKLSYKLSDFTIIGFCHKLLNRVKFNRRTRVISFVIVKTAVWKTINCLSQKCKKLNKPFQTLAKNHVYSLAVFCCFVCLSSCRVPLKQLIKVNLSQNTSQYDPGGSKYRYCGMNVRHL